jgi:hypothetical protein
LSAALSNDIGEGLDDLADIGKIDLFIRSMDVRSGSTNTKGDDLSVWVLALELLKERN